ncbi:hypothetical protein [Vitreimonas sp.]|jgi:hypothetical protein|uniref:hypothetical protein n=1 Tax=Vitreimonas sp. TaxID=3069702 RepID=UPI002EDB8026
MTSPAETLLFEVLQEARAFYDGLEIEEVVILVCVAEATMRPIVVSAKEELLRAEFPADADRGWISRRLIAERTGLPRETVRRKVQRLIDRDMLDVDAEGRVRSVQLLSSASLAQNLERVRQSVGRYLRRVD